MASEEATDEQYGKMVDQYVNNIKQSELMEKELTKLANEQRLFAYSKLDTIFPLHMQLGKFDRNPAN